MPIGTICPSKIETATATEVIEFADITAATAAMAAMETAETAAMKTVKTKIVRCHRGKQAMLVRALVVSSEDY